MRYCCERAVSRENPDDEARNLSPLGSVDLLGASVRTIEMQRDLLTVATVFVFSLSVYGSKPQWLHDEAKDTQSVVLTVRSGLPLRHSRRNWLSNPMLPHLPSECFPASRANNGPDNQGPTPLPDTEQH